MSMSNIKGYSKQPLEIDFWFIVLFSVQKTKSNTSMSQAFLINAVVMIAFTIESLLNNLAEEYLPQSDYKRLVVRRGATNDRLKNIIRALAGAEGQKIKQDVPRGTITIEVNNVGDFFVKNHGGWCWSDITQIFDLRDCYVHYKAELEAVSFEQTGTTAYRVLPLSDRLSYDQVAQYIVKTEGFFKSLHDIFRKSIKSKSSENLLRWVFSFPEIAQRNVEAFDA